VRQPINVDPDIEQELDDDLELYFKATAIQRAPNSSDRGKKGTKSASK
jgi:hypothetical protein